MRLHVCVSARACVCGDVCVCVGVCGCGCVWVCERVGEWVFGCTVMASGLMLKANFSVRLRNLGLVWRVEGHRPGRKPTPSLPVSLGFRL